MEHTTIEDIKTAVTALIGDDYTIDTNEQSFTRYPINHVNLSIGDHLYIEVGQIIYDQVFIDQDMIDNLKNIIQAIDPSLHHAGLVTVSTCDDGSYNITAEDLEGECYTLWVMSAENIHLKVIPFLNQLEDDQNEDD